MSILQLNKVSLVGLTEQKLTLLDALQHLGMMHVIPLQEAEQRESTEESVNPERLKRALQYLLSSREKRRQVVRLRQFNLSEMLDRIDHNRSQRLDLMSRRDFLEKRIADLTPWGDFLLPDLDDLAGQKLWFYLVPNFKMSAVCLCCRLVRRGAGRQSDASDTHLYWHYSVERTRTKSRRFRN